MLKHVRLKTGAEAVIRPLVESDLDASLKFFLDLPEEDRTYLRTDVTRREFVEQRIRALADGGVHRLVAVVSDEIVADGGLFLESLDWKRHVGEIRLIVARPYQRKGLGMLMARELYALAASERVEEILVRFMRPQAAARSIFEKLGFSEAGAIPDYVKDLSGTLHDLILMRCDLEELWQRLEAHLESSDWQQEGKG